MLVPSRSAVHGLLKINLYYKNECFDHECCHSYAPRVLVELTMNTMDIMARTREGGLYDGPDRTTVQTVCRLSSRPFRLYQNM